MHIGLVIAKLITVFLGIVISVQAYRGYRRSGDTPMLHLAAGFSVVSVGAVVEGVLYELGRTIFLAGMIQSVIVAVGMVLVLYSLYGQ
ncbi:DUF7521 family protein [Haladaptatus sp. NG-SE-30]